MWTVVRGSGSAAPYDESAVNAYIRWMREIAYGRDSFIRRWRAQRMQEMLRRLSLPPSARVIDLGGTEDLWTLVDTPVHVTLVNTPGSSVAVTDPTRFHLVHGDACDLRAFADASFDLAFSNSVIEHVGDDEHQAAFAREVCRLGRAYWVQTPSDRFPLEAHTGVPFYWALPSAFRSRLIKRWRGRSPEWAYAIENTRVLGIERMRALFPDGEVFVERKLGFEKSYAFFRRATG